MQNRLRLNWDVEEAVLPTGDRKSETGDGGEKTEDGGRRTGGGGLWCTVIARRVFTLDEAISP